MTISSRPVSTNDRIPQPMLTPSSLPQARDAGRGRSPSPTQVVSQSPTITQSGLSRNRAMSYNSMISRETSAGAGRPLGPKKNSTACHLSDSQGSKVSTSAQMTGTASACQLKMSSRGRLPTTYDSASSAITQSSRETTLTLRSTGISWGPTPSRCGGCMRGSSLPSAPITMVQTSTKAVVTTACAALPLGNPNVECDDLLSILLPTPRS